MDMDKFYLTSVFASCYLGKQAMQFVNRLMRPGFCFWSYGRMGLVDPTSNKLSNSCVMRRGRIC